MSYFILTLPAPKDAEHARKREEQMKALGMSRVNPYYWPEHQPEKYNRMDGSYETISEKFGR